MGEVVTVEQRVFQFVPVPSAALPMWWGQVEKLLLANPKTWEPYYDLENIYNGLQNDLLTLFITLDKTEVVFAMMVQVNSYPKCRVVSFIWAAGREVDKYLVLGLEALHEFAVMVGAAEVKVEGRLGWKKILAPYGYNFDRVILRRPVVGECTRMM